MQMYRRFTLLVVTCIYCLTVCGQSQNIPCNCPSIKITETEADTAFKFSNGKTIVLCGYTDTETQPITFSEFVLAVCGRDTIIDFWGALFTGRIVFKKDTLFIHEIIYIPAGKDFAYKEAVWTIEKIYFNKQKVIKKTAVNRQIPKYSKEKIALVLKEYETAKPGLDESKMELANRLFMATISGSKTARKYLGEFEKKFGGLDGHLGEEYIELIAMLEMWDKKD